MPDRDPRTDPREGDELRDRRGKRLIVVDLIRDGWVYWRTFGVSGELMGMSRKPLGDWTALAVEECEAPHAAP